MKRYTYTGERVPFGIPVCVYEGWLDFAKYNETDNLYRYPRWKRAGWRIGNALAKRVTNSPSASPTG